MKGAGAGSIIGSARNVPAKYPDQRGSIRVRGVTLAAVFRASMIHQGLGALVIVAYDARHADPSVMHDRKTPRLRGDDVM